MDPEAHGDQRRPWLHDLRPVGDAGYPAIIFTFFRSGSGATDRPRCEPQRDCLPEGLRLYRHIDCGSTFTSRATV